MPVLGGLAAGAAVLFGKKQTVFPFRTGIVRNDVVFCG
jgi:hypothetical protein